MYLDFNEPLLLVAYSNAELLSQYNFNFFSIEFTIRNLVTKLWSHTSWIDASWMNSTVIVEDANRDCLALFHKIALSANIKISGYLFHAILTSSNIKVSISNDLNLFRPLIRVYMIFCRFIYLKTGFFWIIEKWRFWKILNIIKKMPKKM